LPYSNAEWEKLSIFLDLLTPKLPAPKEEDLAKGILEAIDMDSYRVEKKAAMKIALADEDAEIEPVPTDSRGHKPEPELDRLSNILKTFNEQFGTLFTDTDRVAKRIRDDIAPKVAADAAYQNAKENTPHTARMAHDQALAKGDATPAEGRHPGLQAVRRERVVQRQQLGEHQLQRDEAPNCIAALSYVYNHHERELAERLTTLQHRHHDLTLSTMHAHLDHDDCIETVFLCGPTPAVRDFSNLLLAERGRAPRHAQSGTGRHRAWPPPAFSGHWWHAARPHVHSRPKT
jgi:nickel-responsive transcriptional regulator NikR